MGVTVPQVKAMNQDLFEELSRLYNKRSGEYVFPTRKLTCLTATAVPRFAEPASMPGSPTTPGTASGTTWPAYYPMSTRYHFQRYKGCWGTGE